MLHLFCPPSGPDLAARFLSPSTGRSRRNHRESRSSSDARRSSRWRAAAALAILPLLALALTGCTAPVGGSASGSLQISPGTVTFGAVTVGSTSTANISLVNQGSAPVEVSSLSVTGDAFSLSGSSSIPFTVAANGGSYTVSVKFNPAASGSASGELTVVSDSTTDATHRIGLIGTGTLTRTPTLSSLTCTYSTMAPGTDPCTVSLDAAAPTGGIAVTLSSSNAAVTLPASITIPAGATSASFSAVVSAASGSQAVILTASAGGKPESFDLQIEVAAPAMSLSATSLAFGTSPINTPVAQNVTLTSTGAAAITISSATLTGTGFSVSGASLPVTLTPGQTATLTVQFDPTIAGAVSGQLTLTSDAASGSTTAIPLTGTGQPTITAFSCTTSSFLGAGTDACTVTLNAVAASSGFVVNLSSNDAAVTVPATVTVAAGSASASFSASVSSVTSSQTAILSANVGGTSSTFDVQLGDGVPTLSLGASSLSFGSVAVNTATSQLVTLNSTGTASVVISSASISGSGFTISGATFPLTIGANQSASLTVQFDPTLAGATSGQLTLVSNSSTGSSTSVALSGTGVPVLTSLSCTSSSMTGSGTDTCTVALNAAAPSGGFTVGLSSNNSAVTVPASVTVPAGSASASFSATVASVSTAQTVTLSSNAGTVSKTFSLQLNAAVSTISINSTSIAFGDVSLNTPATQTLTITSTGALPLIVTSATISGTGFSISGLTLPLTLTTNQTATLSVVFDPTAAGSATGQLLIVSDSLTNPTETVSLSGTGQGSYQVNLTWDAPTSSTDPVAGYNIYRSPSGASSYTLLKSVSSSTLSYSDTSSLTDGLVYDYIVESVDASGNDSVPSNTAVVTIPSS